MSASASDVAKQELDKFEIPKGVSQHSENDMSVPFVSGSARFDAMVIVPCSMATLGRIASGSSDNALARNVITLLEAGAIVLPAIPSFYSRPSSVAAVVDTVVWRILDQIGLPSAHAYRWGRESASVKSSGKKR